MLTPQLAEGQSDKKLAFIQLNNRLYVSAHHWTRGRYHQAKARPNVMVEKKQHAV